ncbi:hypothetical protein [Paenibacillus sp. KR2-11]
MSDFPDEYTLAETIAGDWRKLGLGVKAGTLLIPMSDSVLISVHLSSKRLDLLLRDSQGIFQYGGDFAFEGLEETGKLLFHSWSIEYIHLNDPLVMLDNPLSEMTQLYIKLSLDKRKETEHHYLGY